MEAVCCNAARIKFMTAAFLAAFPAAPAILQCRLSQSDKKALQPIPGKDTNIESLVDVLVHRRAGIVVLELGCICFRQTASALQSLVNCLKAELVENISIEQLLLFDTFLTSLKYRYKNRVEEL